MSWNHQKKPLNSNPKELSNPAEKANQVNPLFNANVLPAPTMDSPCRSLVFRPNQTNTNIMLLKYHSLMVTAPALTKKERWHLRSGSMLALRVHIFDGVDLGSGQLVSCCPVTRPFLSCRWARYKPDQIQPVLLFSVVRILKVFVQIHRNKHITCI